MKEFVTAAKAERTSVIEGAEPLTFMLDGVEMTALPPTAGQFAFAMAAQSEFTEPVERVKALIDFLGNILDEESFLHLRSRLMDRDDPLGDDWSQIEDIIEWLVEEWSARPTQPPSASSGSRGSTGRKSTAKQRSLASAS